MKVAEYIAKILAEHTPGTVFLLSGTGAIHLDDAIAKESGLSYICSRHEATAAVMAAASARVSGKIGSVIVTTGPGAVNAIGGLVEAWVDSTPLLVISGQVATSQITSGVRTFGVQGFDILSLVSPVTKYSHLVRDAKTIRFHVEKALYEARAGRPGPVWLDIPFDLQAAEIGDPAQLEGFVPPPAPARRPLTDAVAGVLAALRLSKRPLLILGQGVRQAGAAPDFLKLAQALGVPVVSTRAAADIIPYGHPLHMGLGGVRGRLHTGLVMEQADLVLSLGSSLAHSFVGEARDAFSPSATIVMVDLDEAELTKSGQRVDLPVRADVGQFIGELLDALPNADLPTFGPWLAECQDLKAAHPVLPPEKCGDPINSYHLVQRLEAHSNSGHIFVSDAGGSYYATGQALTFDGGQRELTAIAFATMGIALPLAIGGVTADPSAEAICLSGDGSIELNIQELRTIAQYDLPVKVFIINNGGYSSIRHSQDEFCDGNYTDDAGVLNFEKVADAFGLPFARIGTVADLDPVIARVLAKTGPVLVEVLCDTQQQIVAPLRQRTGAPVLLEHA